MVNPSARCPLSHSTPTASTQLPESTRIPTLPKLPGSPLYKIPPYLAPPITNNFTMAPFRTTTIAAALFCLFSISLSRAPPQIDEPAGSTHLVTYSLTNPDPELRLPTEPLKSEADAKSNTDADSDVSSVPLADTSFRPINRRFQVRSKRPCRHHFKFYPTTRENKETPYGNDVIVVEEPIVRGGGKRIPGRWMRMPHHHHQLRHRIDEDTDSDSDSDDDENVDRVKKVVMKRYNHDRLDREKRMKKLREHFRARMAEEEKPKKAGFMKGVRKFLDRYI